MSDEQHVRSDRTGMVGLVVLDRPAKLNALDRAMLDQMVQILREFDADESIRAIVLAGGEKAFAAGADVGDLAEANPIELYTSGFSEKWDEVAAISTPTVAAVSGYALGGGLELALICDIIVADPSASFGLPEASIGTMPGSGGTQRLVRAVGKSLAMEMILAGRRLSAEEAFRQGLVSTLAEPGAAQAVATSIAERIAASAPLAVRLARSAVLESFDATLTTGIRYERALSAILAASLDQAEGLRAFTNKKKPRFVGR
ncbi:enoyl-CoA hydratase-related protein [uncultured Enterovirga sp.]|uniref:enoyl-CoA hydratase-related protein n=1 Tax=uncultured Enterovirga sp. TaxID=2026352 RepID=UPI0035CA0C93